MEEGVVPTNKFGRALHPYPFYRQYLYSLYLDGSYAPVCYSLRATPRYISSLRL
jgi:hypothetical protein